MSAVRRTSSRLASRTGGGATAQAAAVSSSAKGTKPSTASASSKRNATAPAAPATENAGKKLKKTTGDDEDKAVDGKGEQSAEAALASTDASTTKTSNETNFAKSTLSVGDLLPDVELVDEENATINIGKSLRKCVIFTYPKANTGGCTKQACLYRDEYDKWQKAGYAVYGLSNDGPTSLKNWKTKQNFQYTLLSDPKRQLIGALTGSKSSTPRSHFVIDASGKVALSTVGVKPAESSVNALKFVQSL